MNFEHSVGARDVAVEVEAAGDVAVEVEAAGDVRR